MIFLRNDVTIQPKEEPKKGGSRAAIFVFVMASVETMTFISNGVSLFTYFNGYMNFSLTKSATALTNYMGTAFLLSLFGGFISDTYFSTFKTCLLFGSFEVVGYGVLAIQAHMRELRPFPCKDVIPSESKQCESASKSEEAILFTSLYLVALGTGGIKAALPSLGADQFEETSPGERAASHLSTFFNCYMFFLNLGAIFGVTFVVWINDKKGWDWAFGLCSMAMAIAVLFLTLGRSFFRINAPKGSHLTRVLQVLVAAIRNRNLPLPERVEELHEVDEQETQILERTNQFRFLDRAAIVRPLQDTNKHESWKMCRMSEIEETKILIRMLPILVSTIFMNTCLAQLQTFSIQQSMTTNRNIGSFQIPASSIPVIPLLFMLILIPFYDRLFVPLAKKFTGIPTGITQLQRIGVGLVLSAISMVVSGFVEMHRKNVAKRKDILPISIFWIGIQYAIFGVADIFTLVGMLEFFYAESSSGMKSLGTAISWCSFAFGYYMSSVVVNVVNQVSGGWLASNELNEDKLEYFYWLLAGLCVVNFGLYLVCASWYKYKKVQVKVKVKEVDCDI